MLGGFFILSNSNEELAEYHINGPGRFLTGNPLGLRLVGWILLYCIHADTDIIFIWLQKANDQTHY